jgi:hypothetical protein
MQKKNNILANKLKNYRKIVESNEKIQNMRDHSEKV